MCGRGEWASRKVSKKDYRVVLGKPLCKPHCILTLWPSCTGSTDGVRHGNFCCLGERIIMVNVVVNCTCVAFGMYVSLKWTVCAMGARVLHMCEVLENVP